MLNNQNFRPMLAASIELTDIDRLHYPIWLQPKLDGIRCCIIEGEPKTRSLKKIPNKHIRETLRSIFKHKVSLYDGEIIVGNAFQDCSSAVMSHRGIPDFTYYIFDEVFDPTDKFHTRFQNLSTSMLNFVDAPVELLETFVCLTPQDVFKLTHFFTIEQDYEGVILRGNRPYIFKRSTLAEEALLKIKLFHDSEATVIRVNPLYENTNIPYINELGFQVRASKRANLLFKETMGSLTVEDKDMIFDVGTGFTQEERLRIWSNKDKVIGKIIKYKYQKKGIKVKPRSPVFLGWRHSYDM